MSVGSGTKQNEADNPRTKLWLMTRHDQSLLFYTACHLLLQRWPFWSYNDNEEVDEDRERERGRSYFGLRNYNAASVRVQCSHISDAYNYYLRNFICSCVRPIRGVYSTLCLYLVRCSFRTHFFILDIFTSAIRLNFSEHPLIAQWAMCLLGNEVLTL